MALLAIAILCTVPAGASEIFYSVDFGSPLNQVGQPPATGLGSATPSSIVFGSPTVVSSFGHLTQQPLLFTAIHYQQIEFDLWKGVPDYFLDFDFETRNLNPSLFAYTVLFDTPTVQNFSLHGWGEIDVPPANSPALPGWSDDELHHMHIGVDLPGGRWIFQLDDQGPVTGPFASDTGDILSIRMNLSTWYDRSPDDASVQVAIDNILIGTSIPEPSSMALAFSALGALLLLRRRKHRCGP
jgi:hypothetical protein